MCSLRVATACRQQGEQGEDVRYMPSRDVKALQTACPGVHWPRILKSFQLKLLDMIGRKRIASNRVPSLLVPASNSSPLKVTCLQRIPCGASDSNASLYASLAATSDDPGCLTFLFSLAQFSGIAVAPSVGGRRTDSRALAEPNFMPAIIRNDIRTRNETRNKVVH
ncbi:hypothetical protein CC1G_15214 [Coprinopsis cinerea okayama7|uniref:Uncharacterized protein n=1 Tax=Coprinopsis cinerea (strain Okayama-7 / 130 / ATCC MYA-4618 / FGSC 9003) TaxID=240176 RepID=D6RPJ9_COPC7|nr:hypothetical protein CC1G_15214 [Coprinopsis cinerea okayama7\|eukprot:XP_002910579.1 hypothetical protein CC1G_15214 [Coprinopsis cinerea okayama7\